MDCAKPVPPPRRHTRDPRRFWVEYDEPMPTSAAASSNTVEVGATESSSRPTSVKPIPTDKRIRAGLAVRVEPDGGLEQRRRELEGQRDQTDLTEVEAERSFSKSDRSREGATG